MPREPHTPLLASRPAAPAHQPRGPPQAQRAQQAAGAAAQAGAPWHPCLRAASRGPCNSRVRGGVRGCPMRTRVPLSGGASSLSSHAAQSTSAPLPRLAAAGSRRTLWQGRPLWTHEIGWGVGGGGNSLHATLITCRNSQPPEKADSELHSAPPCPQTQADGATWKHADLEPPASSPIPNKSTRTQVCACVAGRWPQGALRALRSCVC